MNVCNHCLDDLYRFLLRKVLQHQSQAEAASLACGTRPIPPSPQAGALKSPGASSTMSLDSSTDNITADKTPATSKRKKKPAEKSLDKAEKNRVAKELIGKWNSTVNRIR